MPVGGDEDIRGFDVPVNDSLSVGRVQSVRDLDRQFQESIRFEARPLNEMFESLALQQLHGDKGLAFILIHIVNGADVRVIQTGGSLGLALETRQRLGVSGDGFRQEF